MNKQAHIARSAATLRFAEPMVVCYVVFLTDIDPIVFPGVMQQEDLASASALSAVDDKLIFVTLSQKEERDVASTTVTCLIDGAFVYEQTLTAGVDSDVAWHAGIHVIECLRAHRGRDLVALIDSLSRSLEEL